MKVHDMKVRNMKVHGFTMAALLASSIVALTPAIAAEGKATGNGTSTPAGPAGKTDKMGGMKDSKMGGMKDSTNGQTPTGEATGAGENKPTATGGQPGGSPAKN